MASPWQERYGNPYPQQTYSPYLPNPHPAYDQFGQRIVAPQFTRAQGNEMAMANRQADPNRIRGLLFNAMTGAGMEPGTADFWSAPGAFMPVVGDAMDAEDAYQSLRAGDYLGAGIAGLAAVAPFVPGAVRKMGKKAGKGAKKGIRAYHGSPHDFDEFRMDKIGTGEGAQAYGHGLYFAENEGTALSYRDDLTKMRVAAAQRHLAKSGGDVDAALKAARDEIDRLKSLDLNEATGAARRDSLVQLQEEKIAELNAYKKSGEMNKGRMYEVNIHASPEDFLDWDKPLSEQGQVVKDAANAIANANPRMKDALWRTANEPGWSFYSVLGDNARTGDLVKNQTAAASMMRQQGIPGIKYLDQGSRTAGEGTRNYVVFDPSIIEIVRKYGIAGALGLGLISQEMAQQMQAQGMGS